MNERCKTCKFWNFDGQGPITSDDNGNPIHENDYWADCSRFPPVLFMPHNDVNYEPVRWQKPSTAAADWCGEWKAVGRLSESVQIGRDSHINTLRLSPRTTNFLTEAGYETIDKLLRATNHELLMVPNVGMKAILDTKSALLDWVKERI